MVSFSKIFHCTIQNLKNSHILPISPAVKQICSTVSG